MAKKRSAWLWGCGIGCGLLLLVAVAIPVGGALFVRGTLKGFDRAIDSRDALESRYGAPEEFTPWPAAIPAERIEAFLQVRDATQPLRGRVTERFTTIFEGASRAPELEAQGPLAKLRFALGMGKSALGLAPALGDFFEARNAALLEAGMGLGEYAYLYDLAYYGLLHRNPAEGPRELLSGEVPDDFEIDVPMTQSLTRVRRELRRMLEQQLAALPLEQTDPEWRMELAAEIEVLEADRQRFPWQDGLPPSLRTSLDPYRERLETTYSAATNPFELSRSIKQGRFGVRTE